MQKKRHNIRPTSFFNYSMRDLICEVINYRVCSCDKDIKQVIVVVVVVVVRLY